MKILIQKNTTLTELNDLFSEAFSGLRLGFFIDKNHDQILTANEEVKDLHMPVNKLSEASFDGEIDIEGRMTVNDVEALFKNTLGIEVQLFRKSGNNWLRTVQTDSWTLDEQQKVALESMRPVEDEDKNFNFRDQQDIE